LAWRGVQDGSYSRGPISLLPDELAVTDNYFAPPTFTIEQVFMDSKEILLLFGTCFLVHEREFRLVAICCNDVSCICMAVFGVGRARKATLDPHNFHHGVWG
jgi:hypothetical protein